MQQVCMHNAWMCACSVRVCVCVVCVCDELRCLQSLGLKSLTIHVINSSQNAHAARHAWSQNAGSAFEC